METKLNFIPHTVKLESFSDFRKKEYEDERGQKYTRNQIKEGFSSLSKLRFKYTGGIGEVEEIMLFYLRVRSQDQPFSLSSDFFRNVKEASLLTSLNNFYGDKWVFSETPVINIITSGLYELTGKIETVYTTEKTLSLKEEISISPLEINLKETLSFSIGDTIIITIESLEKEIILEDFRQEITYDILVSQSDEEIITQLEANILV